MDGGGYVLLCTSRCPFKKKTCFLIIKAICCLRHYGPEMCYHVLVSGMFWCSRGSRGLDRIPREGLMCYLSSYICKNRTALEDKQYKACLAVYLCVLRTCWRVCLQVLESNHMFSEAHPPHIKWPHTELSLTLSSHPYLPHWPPSSAEEPYNWVKLSINNIELWHYLKK